MAHRNNLILATVLTIAAISLAGTWIASPGKGSHASGAFDSDASDFFTRVVSNGGTISGSTQTAVNTFVVAAKANGYWTKINRINLFCGNQLAAAMVPLKIGGGSSVETNVNFVGGDYTEATGLTGNGSTKYLNTGFSPSATLTANSTHQSVYNRSSSATGAGQGSQDGLNRRVAMNCPWSDGVFYDDQYDPNPALGRVSSGSAMSTPFGFLVGSRTSSTAHAVYRNGTSLNSNANSSGVLPSTTYYVFCVNVDGAASLFANYAYGSYSIGDGLTSTEVTNFNTNLEAFQDALGRGVQ